ncbi:uncharacterized protein [Ambystoma mexicanum]|uniref:uncharacterized protein n=1 Tax=Ambystoma mexicanum TaxID=8296 RepID=UPI0037E7822D
MLNEINNVCNSSSPSERSRLPYCEGFCNCFQFLIFMNAQCIWKCILQLHIVEILNFKAPSVENIVVHSAEGCCCTPICDERRHTRKEKCCKKQSMKKRQSRAEVMAYEDKECNEVKTETLAAPAEDIIVQSREGSCCTPICDSRRHSAKCPKKSKCHKERTKSHNKSEEKAHGDKDGNEVETETLVGKPKHWKKPVAKKQMVKPGVFCPRNNDSKSRPVSVETKEGSDGMIPYDERRDTEKAFAKWKDYEEEYKVIQLDQGSVAPHKVPAKSTVLYSQKENKHFCKYDERRDTEKAFQKFKDYREQYKKEQHEGEDAMRDVQG